MSRALKGATIAALAMLAVLYSTCTESWATCPIEADGIICAQQLKDCGTFVADYNGALKTVNCGSCSAGLSCINNCCTMELPNCTPESDSTFCGRYSRNCGSHTATDNCNEERTVISCGICDQGYTCSAGDCVLTCTPESDPTFCSRLSAECGALTANDNCNVSRTVTSCGTCGQGYECSSGDCILSCVPESNSTFCSRLSATCGALTANDNCGTPRTVTSCGTCSQGYTCSNNTCSCTPESDPTFCSRLSATCGSLTANDNCGTQRTVTSCGTCDTGQTCSFNACIVSGGSTATRPAYNTGVGFFTVGNKLYDANGNEFRIRGVNKTHYDSDWQPGLPNGGSNSIRWGVPLWAADSITTNLITASAVTNDIVPITGIWYINGTYESSDSVTCKSETTYLEQATARWVEHASVLEPYEQYLLVNPANEWGPPESSVWRDAYITSVTALRNAGFGGALIIDAGGCGQDPHDLISYAQAVMDADPQHNLVFSLHIYGNFCDSEADPVVSCASWQHNLHTYFDSLAALNLPIIIGEFGPGRNIGPSPTMITPLRVMQLAEAHGFGWLAWAWDDGPWGNCDDGIDGNGNDWFSMTLNCSSYTPGQSGPPGTGLSTFGKVVVEDPSYGLLQLATKATILTQ